MSYHNTTVVRDPELKKYQKEAKRQEDVVMKMFEIYESQKESFSKWDLTELYPTFILPTSVGRCLSDLYKAGKLVRLDERQISKYGRSEFLYKLKK